MATYKKIRLGILGTGGMANLHAESFKAIHGVELTACMDVDLKRAGAFAKRHGVRHVCDREDQLYDAVDAVSIVTPDRFHVGQTIAALKAGLHVMCEKPLGTTLTEAKRAARAATTSAKNGRVHMINFSYRNSAAFHYAAKLVADGKLGEVRHVHSSYLQQWLAVPTWGHWSGDGWLWRLQTAAGSGGVLGDIGCHLLDFTTGVAGPVKALGCRLHTFKKQDPATGRFVSRYKGKQLDANDSAMIELAFDGGGVGQAHTTRWATGKANSIVLHVHGTEGALAIDLDDDYNHIRLCLGRSLKKAEWKKKVLKATPTMYQRFIRSIRTGRNDQPDLTRGAQVQAYLDACERSSQAGGKMVVIKQV